MNVQNQRGTINDDMKEIENQPADAHCTKRNGSLKFCEARAIFDSSSSARTLSTACLILRRLSSTESRFSKVSVSESNCTRPFRSLSMSRFVLTILPDRSIRVKKLPTMSLPALESEGGRPGSVGARNSSSDNVCSEPVWFKELEDRSPRGYY